MKVIYNIKMIVFTLLSSFVYSSYSYGLEYKFPDDFMFGVATASYQVEGAWNISGKGENIWDRLTHSNPDHIKNKDNGDIACDTYHNTVKDVQLLKELGVDVYRFSLSWSRILPTGHSYKINPDGLRYYNELIDELLRNNIKPCITLYHWDLPQPLQELGGWANRLIVDYFEDYADLVFENFGDRVEYWITINEPKLICEFGYSLGVMAPAYTQQGIGDYLCGHNVLLAHARAYRLYESKYKEKQNGKIGIAYQTSWYEPLNLKDEEDVRVTENSLQMEIGWFAHPIFSKSGDYPPVMKERINTLSESDGFKRSRLPSFTEEEIKDLRGSCDFLGLNHYTTVLCTPIKTQMVGPSHLRDIGAECGQDENWESTASNWFKVVPWGIRKLLNWIKDQYDNPEVIITENGYSDIGELQDCGRVSYYNRYLAEVLKAVHEDGCNITGYLAWSFLDNFEWDQGYTAKFGLYHIDFKALNRTRTPKMSSYVYKNIIKHRKIDWDYTPDGFTKCESPGSRNNRTTLLL